MVEIGGPQSRAADWYRSAACQEPAGGEWPQRAKRHLHLRPLPSPSIASSALPRSPGRRFSWDRRSLVPTRLGTAGLGDEPRSKPLRKPADAAAGRGGRPALRGLAQAWRSLPRSGQLPARPGQVRLPLQCPRPTGGPDRVNKPMFNINDNQMKRICELCVIFDNFL